MIGRRSFAATALYSGLIFFGSHITTIMLSVASPLSTSFTKVIIPAVYKEWSGPRRHPPLWFTNETLQKEYGYSTFLYQKLNESYPHYLSTNRGCENGAYYNYIVDHYDNFPDIAIFVHANPESHSPGWLDMVRCVRPKASFISLNLDKVHCRKSWNGIWAGSGIWIEQCLRDVLRIAWNMTTTEELNARLPPNQPIKMCTQISQQFILSREMVHKRPKAVWQNLLNILSAQNACHIGEPDYDNLYAFNASSRMRLGPERPDLGMGTHKYGSSPGRVTQAVASEHLAHVIFGQLDLEISEPTMDDLCDQFLDSCPGSPCTRPITSTTGSISDSTTDANRVPSAAASTVTAAGAPAAGAAAAAIDDTRKSHHSGNKAAVHYSPQPTLESRLAYGPSFETLNFTAEAERSSVYTTTRRRHTGARRKKQQQLQSQQQ